MQGDRALQTLNIYSWNPFPNSLNFFRISCVHTVFCSAERFFKNLGSLKNISVFSSVTSVGCPFHHVSRMILLEYWPSCKNINQDHSSDWHIFPPRFVRVYNNMHYWISLKNQISPFQVHALMTPVTIQYSFFTVFCGSSSIISDLVKQKIQKCHLCKKKRTLQSQRKVICSVGNVCILNLTGSECRKDGEL